MTLFLVRHGSAGVRHGHDPLDTARHLDDVGLRQAASLPTLLTGDPITRVLSSPADRCVETVEPLAFHLGLSVERHDDLFEGASIVDAWELVASLAIAGAESRTSAVLCSHGDVIPEIIGRARGRGMETPGKSGCSKGSIWALHWGGEHFTFGEYCKNPG